MVFEKNEPHQVCMQVNGLNAHIRGLMARAHGWGVNVSTQVGPQVICDKLSLPNKYKQGGYSHGGDEINSSFR